MGDVLALPSDPDFLFVDVGYGDAPVTTERTHDALKCLFPGVQTVGVEAEPSRVLRASSEPKANIRYLLGGFDLVRLGIEKASLVRCLNVLRGYGLFDVKGALIQMARAVRPGGVLVEGTSDVGGTLSAVHIWRRNEDARVDYRGLVCVTDFSRGFSPMMFRDVLPRDLRRHAKTGEPVFEWLESWERIATDVRASVRESHRSSKLELGARVFEDSANLLAAERQDTNAVYSARGVMIWCPERPATRPEVLSPDDPLE